MKNLILKELKLNVKWPLYLFSLLGAMTIIPNYCIIVGIGYCILQISTYLQISRENMSQEFSMTLPVRRCDVVHATTFVICLFEMLTVFVAAICAVGRYFIPGENYVGLDANLAFFGVAFMCLGAFNALFLPIHYNTGYKIAKPLVLGLIAFLVVYGIFEALIQAIPVLHDALDSYNAATLWARLVLFAVGIIGYVAITFAAVKISEKRFEKVNL